MFSICCNCRCFWHHKGVGCKTRNSPCNCIVHLSQPLKHLFICKWPTWKSPQSCSNGHSFGFFLCFGIIFSIRGAAWGFLLAVSVQLGPGWTVDLRAPTHTHTNTLLHIHTLTHTHIHTHIYTHTHTHIYTHIHSHTFTQSHTLTHTYIYIYIHTLTRPQYTHIYTYIYTHICTYIHVHIHTHTYTHSYRHTLRRAPPLPPTHTHTHTHTHIYTIKRKEFWSFINLSSIQ